jgi:hypothetical protein
MIYTLGPVIGPAGQLPNGASTDPDDFGSCSACSSNIVMAPMPASELDIGLPVTQLMM